MPELLLLTIERALYAGYTVSFNKTGARYHVSISENDEESDLPKNTSTFPMDRHFCEKRIVDALDYMIKREIEK